MQHYAKRFRATAPTSPTNDANDLLTSNSLSKRDASVLGSPKASSGNLRASARSQTGISRSNSKDRNSGLSPKGRPRFARASGPYRQAKPSTTPLETP